MEILRFLFDCLIYDNKENKNSSPLPPNTPMTKNKNEHRSIGAKIIGYSKLKIEHKKMKKKLYENEEVL